MKDLQRFALSVNDSEGRPQRGEVVLARRWHGEWGREPLPEGMSFLIVMLHKPPAEPPSVESSRVVVCLPRESVAAVAVREPPASYAVADPEAAESGEKLFLLPADVMESFRSGRILASPPLEVRAVDIFRPEQQEARLSALARALLERAHAEPHRPAFDEDYLRALASALAAPHEPGVEAVDAAVAVPRLRRLISKTEQALDKQRPQVAAPAPLSRLRAIFDDTTQRTTSPNSGYRDPLEAMDDVFFCRCLLEDIDSALELAAMREYLEQASIPGTMDELAMDRRVTLEQLSFASLLFEPHRLESMRGTFEFFRKRYSAAYAEHHARFRRGSQALLDELGDLGTCVKALRRLNQLSALGGPLGLDALDAYESALEKAQPCPVEDALAEALRRSPYCPMCRLTLADRPALEEARRIRNRLEKALHQQQTRLAKRVIRHILSTPGEKRTDQFLKIAQAAQLRSIADVLDDDLIAFLRDLLAQPVESGESPLEKFLRSFPAVTHESVGAAVEGFRELLQEALARERAREAGPTGLTDSGQDRESRRRP